MQQKGFHRQARRELPRLTDWDIAACFHAARQVSGDFKERFFAILEKPASSAPELIERVKADLFNHIRRAPQSDDITMIAVHRKA